MKRMVKATLMSLGLLALTSGQAFAQLGTYSPPRINSSPTVSPYLNLMNGMNPAMTYFGIIRPQMQAAQSIQGLQNQFQNMQGNNLNNMNFSQLGMGMGGQETGMALNSSATGHPTMFQNYSFYYPMLNRNGNGNGNGMGNGGMGFGGNGMKAGVMNNRR